MADHVGLLMSGLKRLTVLECRGDVLERFDELQFFVMTQKWAQLEFPTVGLDAYPGYVPFCIATHIEL